jgi:hypothetical protein
MPPRRFQIVFGLTLFITLSIILFTKTVPVDVPAVDVVTDHLPEAITNAHIPHLPQAINPFKPAAHKPPEQANSSIGETRWYIDWRWRNPFSSTVTLDENRAVLPPLKQRPPVYTYYEPNANDPKAVREAEERLLLQWRRAWWAQGFKPVVLGRPEAINNPLYKKIQRMEIGPDMEPELARWLAWGNMGTGILLNWLAFPMAPHDNALLSFLRRGQYPALTRYEGLSNGLFCGDKDSINKAINKVIELPELKTAKSMADKVFTDLFNVDNEHDAIAFYDTAVVEKNYKAVAKALFTSDRAKGLQMLSSLINAHMQVTWQRTFEKGVAVLKPLAEHMTALVEPALDIAGNLTQCPYSPEPTTCPPNFPKCRKCVSSQPLPVTTPPTFRNKSSDVFQIGVVPHPYTTASLVSRTIEEINARFIRRQGMGTRNTWLWEVTKDLLGTAKSSSARIVSFKEAVAGDYSAARSIWLTAEKESTQDLDWIFGFDFWQAGLDRHDSETPVPGPERRPKKDDGPVVDEHTLQNERWRLELARDFIKSKTKKDLVIKEAVEAWHMADTEAWRFARAYAARRVMERKKFEEEEHGFYGAEKSRGRWGRWFDRL